MGWRTPNKIEAMMPFDEFQSLFENKPGDKFYVERFSMKLMCYPHKNSIGRGVFYYNVSDDIHKGTLYFSPFQKVLAVTSDHFEAIKIAYEYYTENEELLQGYFPTLFPVTQ